MKHTDTHRLIRLISSVQRRPRPAPRQAVLPAAFNATAGGGRDAQIRRPTETSAYLPGPKRQEKKRETEQPKQRCPGLAPETMVLRCRRTPTTTAHSPFLETERATRRPAT